MIQKILAWAVLAYSSVLICGLFVVMAEQGGVLFLEDITTSAFAAAALALALSVLVSKKGQSK